ncbi:hypothetical protein HPB50_012059 [Hyalomma asiaticum]|uniref:Uncharacterized protein n=1 Tax=Hyalomma asiaticum TaxID=266040 RepID=A0ACB7T6J4_HYAAI|nr:hypothetical protein HPB50_012059 [Hyalomma asiaticum]
MTLMTCRYKPPAAGTPGDDPTPDYMNVLSMIFSMCGLMLKAVNFRRGHDVPAKPSAHDIAMVVVTTTTPAFPLPLAPPGFSTARSGRSHSEG